VLIGGKFKSYQCAKTICSSRNDRVSDHLKTRLLDCLYLVATEGRYHLHCRQKFKPTLPTSSTPGRPKDEERIANFESVCFWLESEVEIYTLSEIHEKMVEMAESKDKVYSQKWLKTKLKERYREHINFVEEEGKPNKVCFNNIVDFLITDKWYQNRRRSTRDEADRIIDIAAKNCSR